MKYVAPARRKLVICMVLIFSYRCPTLQVCGCHEEICVLSVRQLTSFLGDFSGRLSAENAALTDLRFLKEYM